MGLSDFLSNLFGGSGRGGPSDAGAGRGGGPGGGDATGGEPGGEAAGDEPGGDGPNDDEPGGGSDEETAADDLGPADFREEAEDLADRYEDADLDFTVESLARLDDVAEDQGEILGMLSEDVEGGGDFFAQMHGGYTLWFGSYFGEVLVRAFDGAWAQDEDGWAVAVPVEGGALAVPVFDVAAASVADEPVFRATVADLEEALESVDRAGDADGGAAGGDADDGAAGGDAANGGGEHDTEMAAEAAELAEFWSEYDLDFTVDSLSRLDDLVEAQWGDKERFRGATLGGEGDVDDRVYTGLVKQLGSYYGEVLVRALDAEWTRDDDMGTVVEVPGPDGEEAVLANVFHVAGDCLTEPSKFALNYDVIVDRLGLDAPLAGGEGEVVALDPEEVEAAAGEMDVDDVVAGFAEDAEDLVGAWPGYDLDYSPASLSRLDDLVAAEYADFDFEGVALGDEADGDSLFLTARAMEAGGYLAEVLRRHLDAEWRTGDGPALVVEGDGAEAHLDPVAVAAACFRGEDSFAATYEAVRGRLGLEADGE